MIQNTSQIDDRITKLGEFTMDLRSYYQLIPFAVVLLETQTSIVAEQVIRNN